MSRFTEFLESLLLEGKVVLEQPLQCTSKDTSAALACLARGFHLDSLNLAGPPLSFAARHALAAAQLLADACWCLLEADEPRAAKPPGHAWRLPPAATAAELASVDLVLRYLPDVYRHAHVQAPDQPFTPALCTLLHRWPLAGVLADLAEPPIGDVRLGDHFGLQLRYAERLLQRPRAAWLPSVARTYAVVAMVFQEANQPLPEPASAIEAAT